VPGAVDLVNTTTSLTLYSKAAQQFTQTLLFLQPLSDLPVTSYQEIEPHYASSTNVVRLWLVRIDSAQKNSENKGVNKGGVKEEIKYLFVLCYVRFPKEFYGHTYNSSWPE